MSTLSVNEFKKLLREQVAVVAEDHGWRINNAAERGYAFQYWLVGVIASYEVGFDGTDPDDVCLLSNDLCADIVFEDTSRQQLLICQAKYQAFEQDVEENKVNDFFNRHDLLADRKWVLTNGSDRTRDLLADYGEKIANGYAATYYFFSTGQASERVKKIAETNNASYAARRLPIRCDLFDFSKLKDYYVRSLSLEESPPSDVVFRIPAGRFFEKAEPYPTVVAVLKGNELRALYKRYKDALYAWNIRGYLGNRGINQEIFNTAQNESQNFFYYNNGVSAICTEYEIRDKNELNVKNFQIINGAQTISTLSNAEPNSDIDVLFRLTVTKNVKTDKGINRQIIQYNNTQNAIKVSDFRSNDEIQIWLENWFKTNKATSVIPAIAYLRKRSVGRKGVGTSLKLEEFAKVRYSYLKEPTLIHAAPKRLWSLKDDDGVYETAFGVEGDLLPTWSNETFHEALLAIALYLKIVEESKEVGRRSTELRFLQRLRFHALSLAAEYIRARKDLPPPAELLHSKTDFSSLWSSFWNLASVILIDVHSTAMEQGSTMFAFVRSEDRWEQMRKRLRLRLAIDQ